MLIFIMMIFIFLPFMVKAHSNKISDKSDMFYVKILNNSMALIKSSVFNEEDLNENGFSIKRGILRCFNIRSNPISIIEKEISCINTDGHDNINITFNPFKLNDKAVSSYDEKSSKELNVPNRTVNIYNPKLKKKINKAKIEVFIYHTHTSESFNCEKFSLDEKKNICAVGDDLTNELQENYGINVIHDKTVHDNAYAGAYQRSGKTVDKYLKKYGDFKLLIDLHRDSVENKKAFISKFNGKNVAKFMFVIAKNNPHFKNNMVHVNKMMDISNKFYPSLCRGVLFYERGACAPNQKKSNNSILIELGSYVNDLDEAKRTSKYLARIIAEHLNVNGNK